jgi:predicted transcriptional regulator YdeE
MTKLPNRNLLLRGFYGISLLGMFAFLANEAWSGHQEYVAYNQTSPTEYPTEEATPQQPVAPAPTTVKQTRQPANVATTPSENDNIKLVNSSPIDAFRIEGIQENIDLSKEIDPQLKLLWTTFFKSTYGEKLPNDGEIYAVYSNYDLNNNSVLVTIGLPTGAASANSSVEVAAGDYLQSAQKSVLREWQTPRVAPEKLLYQTDFEQWVFDNNYQPVKVNVYVGLR